MEVDRPGGSVIIGSTELTAPGGRRHRIDSDCDSARTDNLNTRLKVRRHPSVGGPSACVVSSQPWAPAAGPITRRQRDQRRLPPHDQRDRKSRPPTSRGAAVQPHRDHAADTTGFDDFSFFSANGSRQALAGPESARARQAPALPRSRGTRRRVHRPARCGLGRAPRARRAPKTRLLASENPEVGATAPRHPGVHPAAPSWRCARSVPGLVGAGARLTPLRRSGATRNARRL